MKIFSTLCLALVSIIGLSGTLAASESTLPVDLAIRQSAGSNLRYVAHFTNESHGPVSVQVEFLREKSGHHKTFDLTIASGGWKEIGRNQGWNLLSGDQIIITARGYEPKHFHVP